jgi:molecular chaperone GrpE
MIFLGLILVSWLSVVVGLHQLRPTWTHTLLKPHFATESTVEDGDTMEAKSPAYFVNREISRLERKLAETEKSIEEVKVAQAEERKLIANLDSEYGAEISRIKKEFARMKERAIEEAVAVVTDAKVAAVKEVLPIQDNYARAKQVFDPIDESSGERAIYSAYDEVNADFDKVLTGFGLERVVSVGQPFDFNFMEGIMTQPSNEYADGIVSMEYQAGYKVRLSNPWRPLLILCSFYLSLFSSRFSTLYLSQ